MQGEYLGCSWSTRGEPGKPGSELSTYSGAHRAGGSLNAPENHYSLWTRQSVLPLSVALGWHVPQGPSVSASAVKEATAEVKTVIPHFRGDLAIQGLS